VRIEIDLARAADWLADVPTWGWVMAAVHVWYGAAGLVLRQFPMGRKHFITDHTDRTVAWVLSPLVLLCPVVLAAWLSLYASSAGVIPPPWKTGKQ
jgi:hypothetical protein